MELSTYLDVLYRRKWIIILTMLAATLAALSLRSLIPQKYQAEVVLHIDLFSRENPSYSQLVYAERIMNTYSMAATRNAMQSQLSSQLGLPKGRPQNIEAVVIPNSELLQIIVEDNDPDLALNAANRVAEIVASERLYDDIIVSIVEPAKLIDAKSFWGTAVLLLITATLGSIGLAFVIENLDARLHSVEEIRMVSQLQIIGEIPKINRRAQNDRYLDSPKMHDAFRRLCINICALDKHDDLTTLLVTSAESKEGKSTIVINLAQQFALAGRKTLIVDADLALPVIHTRFNLPNSVGLGNVLAGAIAPLAAIQGTDQSDLFVLTSGSAISDLEVMISLSDLHWVLSNIETNFDKILIDSPPVLGAADVGALAPAADGVLLVARRDRVTKGALRSTCRQLAHVEAQLIGVVANDLIKRFPKKYKEYYLLPHADGAHFAAAEPANNLSEKKLSAESDDADGGFFSVLSSVQEEDSIPNTAESSAAVTSEYKDQLTKIRGVGVEFQQAMYDAGITTFSQLAAHEPQELANKIGRSDIAWRIDQDNWIEQAQTFTHQSFWQMVSR